MIADKSRVPVILLTGFLGAGKTTFINWLVRKVPDKKISLILNEFGDIKLETNFVKKVGIGLVTELANGCMCCVAKSDIPRVVRYTLDNAPSTELILIEASGLSDPDPVRDVLQAGELLKLIRLDATICIVDALNFEAQRLSHPLIISQIGDADLVVISKIATLSESEISSIEDKIKNIGLGTKVLRWDDHLNPSFFIGQDIARRDHSPATTPHLDEHLDEFWYFSTHQLSPSLLQSFFSTLPASIIRAKGYTHDGETLVLIQYVGTRLELVIGSDQTPDQTAILFLGQDLDQEALRFQLDSCRVI